MKDILKVILGVFIGLSIPAANAFGTMVIELSESSVHNYYKGCVIAGLLSKYGDDLSPEYLSKQIKRYERSF